MRTDADKTATIRERFIRDGFPAVIAGGERTGVGEPGGVGGVAAIAIPLLA
jgi:hypothetical protein